MKRLFLKLAFIHGRLWRDDSLYPIALVLGPASLLGVLLAFGVWAISAGWTKNALLPAPPWATKEVPPTWQVGGVEKQVVRPRLPLPSAGASDTGYELGWRMHIDPVQISSAYDIAVKNEALKGFVSNELTPDMTWIASEAPKNSIYAGVGDGMLVIKTAGPYAISARFEREAGMPSDCLVRLGFSGKRIISSVRLNIVDSTSVTYDAAQFELEPGLYSIGWVLACWHDQSEAVSGRMTILLRRPGEETLTGLRPGEIVRSVQSAQ
jgi:hypothetical protein